MYVQQTQHLGSPGNLPISQSVHSLLDPQPPPPTTLCRHSANLNPIAPAACLLWFPSSSSPALLLTDAVLQLSICSHSTDAPIPHGRPTVP